MKIEKHDWMMGLGVWMMGLGVLQIVLGMTLWFMPSSNELTAPSSFAKETAATTSATETVVSVSSGGNGGADMTSECLAEGGGMAVNEYEEF